MQCTRKNIWLNKKNAGWLTLEYCYIIRTTKSLVDPAQFFVKNVSLILSNIFLKPTKRVFDAAQ